MAPSIGAPSVVRWWRGRRGEWFVVIQAVLFLLLPFGPRTWRGWPAFAPLPRAAASILAIALLTAGFGLIVSGIVWLRSNLSPLPYPRDCTTLVETGPFRIVRHPMYSGAILMALGWSLETQGLLTLGYALLLFVLFNLKARREEAWLMERFPEYSAYRTRTRQLIPFVF